MCPVNCLNRGHVMWCEFPLSYFSYKAELIENNFITIIISIPGARVCMFPQACCHFSETLSIVAKNSHIYASLPHPFFYINCFGSASCKLQDNWDIKPTSFQPAAFRIMEWCPKDSTKGENYALLLHSLFSPRVAQDFSR